MTNYQFKNHPSTQPDQATTRPTLGTFIRQARKAQGIPAAQLAESLAMHQSYISRLEAGILKYPSPEKLQRIAECLKLDYGDLFALAGYRTPEHLPGLAPYLRAKYHIGDQDIRRVCDYFAELKAKRGITERHSADNGVAKRPEPVDPSSIRWEEL